MEGYINFLLRFERGLNKVGYFPIVGTISGLCRILLASVFQSLVGVLCFAGGLVAAVVTWAVRARDASRSCVRLAQFGKTQSVHAGFNVWRGTFELFPVVGGLACFLYDRAMGGKQLIPYIPGLHVDLHG